MESGGNQKQGRYDKAGKDSKDSILSLVSATVLSWNS